MRTYARAVVLTAVTALAIGGLAAPALAASPALNSADPAPNASLDVDPSGVTLTFDQGAQRVLDHRRGRPVGGAVSRRPRWCSRLMQARVRIHAGRPPRRYLHGHLLRRSQLRVGPRDDELLRVLPRLGRANRSHQHGAIAPDPYNGTSTTLTVAGISEDDDDTVEVLVSSDSVTLTRTVDAGPGGAFTASFTESEAAGLPDGTLTATARSYRRGRERRGACCQRHGGQGHDPAGDAVGGDQSGPDHCCQPGCGRGLGGRDPTEATSLHHGR